MTKKEYLNKLTSLIVNRVKYHSPNLNKNDIDYALLNAVGIDSSYPIFIYKKPLDKLFYKAFMLAKKEADFNLILFEKPLVKTKKIENMPRCYLLLREEIGGQLFNCLDGLNINYLTRSTFDRSLEGEYLKINNKKIEFDYIPYFYHKKAIDNGVIYEVKNYILNGKNMNISLINTRDNVQKTTMEFNLPLPRGYYFFKKGSNSIEIENLTNRAKAFFNYNFKNAKISTSTISGIESCTFACINVKVEIQLLPKQTKRLYFNFGDKKYCMYTPKEMEYFFQLSQNKMNEIFDLKVISHDKLFDQKFNLSLPRKIWEKWQKWDYDDESENEWIKLKNKLTIKSEKGVQINQDFKGLKEVQFYRNYGWKRVFIVHNNACYMYADKIKYFNFTLLTKEIFNKNSEIYLSFTR